MSGSIVIVAPGWSTTLQDHGRPGLAHLGVPRSGPVDRPLADLVNRVVGNAEGTTVLETAGGLVVRAEWPMVVATSTTGAPTPIGPGDEVRVEPGDRTMEYLAVRGGILAERVLGSSSHDVLSGIGPDPVDAGATYEIGPDPRTPVNVDVAPLPPGPDRVRIWPGPRLDAFVGGALGLIAAQRWTVTDRWSRVGVRLRGDASMRHDPGAQMPSEGLVLGAVQLPPSGEPVVMLADHPTTGGYPVIGVIPADDLAALARRRPGSTIGFAPIT